jgi:NitT/TauT family transport system substrate-binding protein
MHVDCLAKNAKLERKMNRVFTSIAAVQFLKKAAAAFIVFGLGVGAATAQEKLTVRMDFIAWGTHAAMHLANRKGWFKEAGLDVIVQDGTGSANTVQLVGAGQVDVGQVQLGVMAVARDKGAKLIAIADFFRKSDLAVLVDKDSSIKSVADLKGKRIVNFNGSPWSAYIDSYLRSGGLTRADVTIVAVAPAALVTTYTSREADAIMTTAPFGLPIINKVRPSKPLLMADAGISFPSYGLIVQESTLEGRAAALKKLVAIEVRAWKYIYGGHIDEAVDAIVAQRPGMKLDRDVLKGQIIEYQDFIDSVYSKGKPLGVQTEEDWAAAMKAMEEGGVIGAGHNPSEFYTNVLFN